MYLHARPQFLQALIYRTFWIISARRISFVPTNSILIFIRLDYGLFVCMSIKTVYLELVSSLSTVVFLTTLDHFVARRGLPLDIFSTL